MPREMAFAMRVLQQNEATRRNLADLPVAGLVLHGAVDPHREHTFRHGVPTHRAHASRNSGEANTCGRVVPRYFERRGVRMNGPFACWDFELIKMGLAVCRGVYAQAPHRTP